MTLKENKTYLHLVNFQNTHSGNRKTSYYDPVEQITSIHELPVKIRNHGIREVILQPEGKVMDFMVEGDYIKLIVPKIHIYSILEIN